MFGRMHIDGLVQERHNSIDVTPSTWSEIDDQNQLPFHHQPDSHPKEDFLFPMSNRLSYASSPESDLDLRPGSLYDDDDEPSPPPTRRLVRSSSDPSIATNENVPGIPPYPAPPHYNQPRSPQSRHPEMGRYPGGYPPSNYESKLLICTSFVKGLG